MNIINPLPLPSTSLIAYTLSSFYSPKHSFVQLQSHVLRYKIKKEKQKILGKSTDVHKLRNVLNGQSSSVRFDPQVPVVSEKDDCVGGGGGGRVLAMEAKSRLKNKIII